MEFGIFSNGFRPHTTAAQTYQEDLAEIVHADQLGFRYAYISEHHGEPVYIDKVDTLPVPELLMCKAAALTKQIRMGAAVKLIHLAHPVDTAIQAAVTDHVVGGGRFIFGFGSGFPNPLFAGERGLSHADRHERMHESLDLILKCWVAPEPFDWDGKYWQGKSIVATPRPLVLPHMPMATATDTRGDDRSRRRPRLYAVARAARTARLDPREGRSLRARRQGRGPQDAAQQCHRRALRLSCGQPARSHGRSACRHQLRTGLSEGARTYPHHHVQLRHRSQRRRRHFRSARRGRGVFPRRSGFRRARTSRILRCRRAASARC